MSLASLALCLVAAYQTDSTVHVPIKEFRKAVTIMVDDSLCRIQSALQDSALDKLQLAYDNIAEAYRVQGEVVSTLQVAVEVSDSGRKALVDGATRIGAIADRWRYLAIAEGVAAVLLLLLLK